MAAFKDERRFSVNFHFVQNELFIEDFFKVRVSPNEFRYQSQNAKISEL